MSKNKDIVNPKKMLKDLSSVVGCESGQIVEIAKKLVEDYPNFFGMEKGSAYLPYRKELLKCLINLNLSTPEIRNALGCKEGTIRKYRRSMEIDRAQYTKELSEVEKNPHIKSGEIINNYNNDVAASLKSNLDTLQERLAESLDDEDKIHKTGVKDLAVALSLISDTYRKVTNQQVKNEIQVNHNFAFPDAPEKVLSNYRPKEIVIEPKILTKGDEDDN